MTQEYWDSQTLASIRFKATRKQATIMFKVLNLTLATY